MIRTRARRVVLAAACALWVSFIEATLPPAIIAIRYPAEAPRPALSAIPADGSRADARLESERASVPSSGNLAARTPAPRHGGGAPDLRGLATWYRVDGLVAAAGPAVRKALGPGWRGSTVRVCAERCLAVRLVDWCACGPRNGRPTLLDLSDAAFAELAPLPSGVVWVRVSLLVPPQTDTE